MSEENEWSIGSSSRDILYSEWRKAANVFVNKLIYIFFAYDHLGDTCVESPDQKIYPATL